MGFFNRNKDKKIQTPTNETNTNKSNIDYSITKDGKLQIDFFDGGRNVGKMYDTTRLIIDNVATQLNNTTILKGFVSWYGRDDAVILNGKNGDEFGRRVDYKEILADIDFNLIQTDSKYCETVMKLLLRQSRVEDYLSMGLQDNPNRLCGEYIGGVRKTEKGYEKIFDVKAGKEAHQRPEMVLKRAQYKEKIEKRKQNQISRNRDEINRLQEEIEEWSQ